MKKTLTSVIAVAFVAMIIANVYAICEPPPQCPPPPCPPPPCPPPPCLPPGYTPGFWKHNIGVALGYNPGKYSAFEDTGEKLTLAMLQGLADIVGVMLEDAYAAVSAKGGPPNNMIRADMANAFNEAAGYGPF